MAGTGEDSSGTKTPAGAHLRGWTNQIQNSVKLGFIKQDQQGKWYRDRQRIYVNEASLSIEHKMPGQTGGVAFGEALVTRQYIF